MGGRTTPRTWLEVGSRTEDPQPEEEAAAPLWSRAVVKLSPIYLTMCMPKLEFWET